MHAVRFYTHLSDFLRKPTLSQTVKYTEQCILGFRKKKRGKEDKLNDGCFKHFEKLLNG